MSRFWFGRSARLAAQNDVQPGNRYRRPLGTHFGAIATVLELCPDLVSIPHVLALQSFLETYCERVLQGDPELGPR
jgi:hypothetical protein